MRASNQEKNSYVRRQILHTLLEMMREQEFQDIVISRLTARAGVGRASFYRNFTGKEDVLRQEADRWQGNGSSSMTGGRTLRRPKCSSACWTFTRPIPPSTSRYTGPGCPRSCWAPFWSRQQSRPTFQTPWHTCALRSPI